MLLRLALTALFLLLSSSLQAQVYKGRVVGVLDGDTIDVLVDDKPIRVRLAQIDAPEKRQPFGDRAKRELSNLLYGRDVVVVEDSRDRYGRVVGTVRVRNHVINHSMVANGWAWVYRQYSQDRALLALEERARMNQLGIWRDADPTPPWEWRRRK